MPPPKIFPSRKIRSSSSFTYASLDQTNFCDCTTCEMEMQTVFLFHCQPTACQHHAQPNEARNIQRTGSGTQPAIMIEDRPHQKLTRNHRCNGSGNTHARNYITDRSNHNQPKETRAERIPGRTAPLHQFAAINQQRDQRDDPATDVHNEYALKDPKPLSDHTRHRALQFHRHAAYQSNQDDQKNRIHVVCPLFILGVIICSPGYIKTNTRMYLDSESHGP